MKWIPESVILVDPVEGQLVCTSSVMAPASKENTCEVVERSSPCVIAILILDLLPSGVTHVSIVSLNQDEASALVTPNLRARHPFATDPRPDPAKLRVLRIEGWLFAARTELMRIRSNEIAWERVPRSDNRSADVTCIDTLTPNPLGRLQCTSSSLTHSVISQALPPALVR